MGEFKCEACSDAPAAGAQGLGMREPLDQDIPDVDRALLQRLASMHPDDTAVEAFSIAMKAKLAEKRAEGRGGWQDKALCSGEYLSQLLREHVEKGDPIDVANFCMMLHQRGERISPPPQAHVEPEPGEHQEVLDAIAAHNSGEEE